MRRQSWFHHSHQPAPVLVEDKCTHDGLRVKSCPKLCRYFVKLYTPNASNDVWTRSEEIMKNSNSQQTIRKLEMRRTTIITIRCHCISTTVAKYVHIFLNWCHILSRIQTHTAVGHASWYICLEIYLIHRRTKLIKAEHGYTHKQIQAILSPSMHRRNVYTLKDMANYTVL